MSASLVGSEMCIRDSSSPGLLQATLRQVLRGQLEEPRGDAPVAPLRQVRLGGGPGCSFAQ
eukprot:8776615-Alexandrium_andersonii.AAC.1